MQYDAHTTLERTISLLERNVPDELREDCEICSNLASAIQTDHELNLIAIHYSLEQLSSAKLHELYKAVQKILIGTNVLTPSLVTRGWKFWQNAPLHGEAKEKVEQASLRLSKRYASGLANLIQTLQTLDDELDIVRNYSRSVRVQANCLADLAQDLRDIIR